VSETAVYCTAQAWEEIMKETQVRTLRKLLGVGKKIDKLPVEEK
jgi:hypothetical protein